MKRIKGNHSTKCYWCKAQGVETVAVWKEQGLGGFGRRACDTHQKDLREHETQPSRITEADEQTWMRL